ncbi:unnamed protein product [Leuciscus chuanchicus]
MTERLIFHLLILTLTAEFSDVRTSHLSSNPPIHFPSGRSQTREPFPIKHLWNQAKDLPSRQITRVKTVGVICHENYMEIAVKVDLFDVDLPVDASELRLGADSQFTPSCKVTAFSNNEYILAAELTDCGTQHWITDDSLIYTNLLIFTPQPSPDGVVRLEQAVVPIECYYSRRFDITSNPIKPTMVPYVSMQSALEDLQFSLKLMTSIWKAADGDDWACYSCQGTKAYAPSFQSILQQSRPPPAPRPDQNSSSPKPNKFQPRIQEDSGSYFSSLLTDSEPIPSWRNLILPQEEDEGIGSVGWELEKTVGPLAIFPKKSKMGFLAPPRVKEGVPPLPSLSKDKKPMPHSSLWKNGVTAEMEQVGGVTPSPSWDPTEQPSITESEPESKKLEKDDEYDSEDEDHDSEYEDEDHDGEDEDHDYEERKGETKESDRGMWKTRVLPEEDFKELFTTHASKNEEDSGLHTFGAIRNLKEGPMIGPDSRQYKVVSLPTEDPTDDSTDVPSSRVAPAQVLCTERSMIVLIRVDLHSNGRHVTAEEFSLGQPFSTKSCKASQYSDTEYVIKADLHQCGSELSIDGDYLVYSNQLIYTPMQNSFGIVRTSIASIPIECRYKRTHFVSSIDVKPSWPTTSALELIGFSFHLMNDDWRTKRSSYVYHLGDVMNIQASFLMAEHAPFRLVMDSCVVTLEPNAASVPRYVFVQNHGCLVDSKVPDSSARFMPRKLNHVLQMQMDAFRFHEDDRNASLRVTSDDDEWGSQCNHATSRLSSSALRKSELPVVRLARTKDSYLTQEYQGTLGSLSQWKYAIVPNPKGGTWNTHMTPGGCIWRNTGVSSRRWNISTPGVARWLAEGKTHAQGGLQWKYTCGGRPEGEPCTWRHLAKRESCRWQNSGVDVISAGGDSGLIRLT